MYNKSHMKQTRATSRHSSIRRFEELKSLSLRIKQTTTADKIRPDWQKKISSCELMSTIWTLSTAVYLMRQSCALTILWLIVPHRNDCLCDINTPTIKYENEEHNPRFRLCEIHVFMFYDFDSKSSFSVV